MATASLKFSADADLADMKSTVANNPHLASLELDGCATLDSATFASLIHMLNEELKSFVCREVAITSDNVKSLVKHCPVIGHLVFDNCQQLDIELCLRSIGTFCQELKSIAFLYDKCENPPTSDLLSVLVKNVMTDLKSVSFVGFDSVSDIGVTYAAECYSSLQSVNLNFCHNLTEASLQGLASNCKHLREVSMNGTRIDNPSVGLIASKCPALHKVDFGNCDKLTDSSVLVLARQCRHLHYICLAGCIHIGDDSLAALTTHCLHLEHIDMSHTCVKTVPVTIVALCHLSVLKLSACNDLRHPPPEVVQEGLSGILEFYKDYSLSHRLKVFLLGDMSGGKSSLMKSLIDGCPSTVTMPTEGVVSQLWQPLLSEANKDLVNRKLSTQETHLLLDLWDMSGRPVCQGIHQMFLTPGALHVIVFNIADDHGCEGVINYVRTIQTKVPGSVIMLVGTHSDHLHTDIDWHKKGEEVATCIGMTERNWKENIQKEIDIVKSYSPGSPVRSRLDRLGHLLQARPLIQPTVHVVSCTTGQGLDAFKKEMLSVALGGVHFRHLGRPIRSGALQLYKHILQLRKDEGIMLMTGSEVKDIGMKQVSSERALLNELHHLHLVGGVFDFGDGRSEDSSECVDDACVCINSSALAHATCLAHIDSSFKAFKLDVGRFWPADTGVRRPVPGALVKVLEEIPAHGTIREVLFPLLWQDIHIDEVQVKRILALLEGWGILMPHTPSSSHATHLELPHFPGLSTHVRYYAPLLDAMPDNRPQLNWSPRPYRGDVQLGWRYVFPHAPPSSLLKKLLCMCRRVVQNADYEYIWRTGLLQKMSEATVCVEYENKHFDICCRANADDYETVATSVELLWAHLSVFVQVIEKSLDRLPGLFHKVLLVPMGASFYGGDVIGSDKAWPLLQCLDSLEKEEDISFVDNRLPRALSVALLFPFPISGFPDIRSWVDFIVSKRDMIFSLMGNNDCSLTPATDDQRSLPNKQQKVHQNKLKNKVVRWSLDETSRTMNSDTTTTLRQMASSEQDMAKDSPQKAVKWSDKDCNTTSDTCSETPESLQETARQLAKQLVASVLTNSVAQCIKVECENTRNTYHHSISTMQAEVAQLTADAVKAAQAGRADEAAQGVLLVACRMQQALEKQEQMFRSVHSTMCTIL